MDRGLLKQLIDALSADDQGIILMGFDSVVSDHAAKVAEMQEKLDLMRTPCKCDPVGSGEEYCNGGCELRAALTKLKEEREKELREAFDAGMSTVPWDDDAAANWTAADTESCFARFLSLHKGG